MRNAEYGVRIVNVHGRLAAQQFRRDKPYLRNNTRAREYKPSAVKSSGVPASP